MPSTFRYTPWFFRLLTAVFMLCSLTACAEGAKAADELASIAHPVEKASDLDPFVEQAGDRRLVLLGEATHGTKEFYEWRAEITRRLITEKNFSFIAVEGDWNAFVPANRYIKNLPGAPASAADALDRMERWPEWMWQNAVMKDFLEWLRTHNDDMDEGRKVGIYGMDIYGAAASLEKAPGYLEALDPDGARDLEADLDCFAPYAGNPRSYITDMTQGRVDCSDGLSRSLGMLAENKDAFREKDPKAWLHAKQNTAVVFRAEKHYRMMTNRDFSSWNARARNFYETVERLMEYYGSDARGIAWAHNTHMGDARATGTDPASDTVMENIGMHARKAMGRENVFILGFGTHRGTVSAARMWEGSREEMTVPEAAPGSLEDILNRTGIRSALFFSDETKAIGFSEDPIGHRAIGVTYDPEDERGNYVPTLWPERYDAFFFIDKTGALAPLDQN